MACTRWPRAWTSLRRQRSERRDAPEPVASSPQQDKIHPRMHLLQRILPLSIGALALVGPASVRLRAATVGGNHPASGAYSPVSPSSWGIASWPLGSSYTAAYRSEEHTSELQSPMYLV